METKEIELGKATLFTAVNSVTGIVDASLIANGLPPVLAPIVGLMAALVTADSEGAKKDLLEWAQFIKENPDIFAQELLAQPIFQKQTVKWLNEYLASVVVYKKRYPEKYLPWNGPSKPR